MTNSQAELKSFKQFLCNDGKLCKKFSISRSLNLVSVELGGTQLLLNGDAKENDSIQIHT